MNTVKDFFFKEKICLKEIYFALKGKNKILTEISGLLLIKII